MKRASFTEHTLPLLLFITFFLIQTLIQPSELVLTLLALIATVTLLTTRRIQGEIKLFLTGLVLGLIIEVGLGLIHRDQFWENASLLGVPYWLPLAWGIGFVCITRIGKLLTHKPWWKYIFRS